MSDIQNDLTQLESALRIIDKIYDVARLVNPYKRSIFRCVSGSTEKFELTDAPCFHFWKQNSSCKNCISSRALNDNRAYTKIEYNGERLYLVMATPLEVSGERQVLEILKDITDSGIFDSNEIKSQSNSINKIINRRNEAFVKDELTGTYNKRYIYERLPFDLIKSVAEDKPLAVIMADIDNFKEINDTWGHVTGDHLLKAFAKAIKSYIRKETDWIARYGGDEFLIILGNADFQTAQTIAERMRRKVEEATFLQKDLSLKVTGSFGGFIMQGEEMPVEKLIDSADKNLYKAKNEGRNRVFFSLMPEQK